MIGKIISHYPPEADPPMAGKILEKLGEGGMPSIIKKYNSLVPPKRGRTGLRSGRCQ